MLRRWLELTAFCLCLSLDFLELLETIDVEGDFLFFEFVCELVSD